MEAGGAGVEKAAMKIPKLNIETPITSAAGTTGRKRNISKDKTKSSSSKGDHRDSKNNLKKVYKIVKYNASQYLC